MSDADAGGGDLLPEGANARGERPPPAGVTQEHRPGAHLKWRFFAGAMLAQTLAILGGVLAMLRLLE